MEVPAFQPWPTDEDVAAIRWLYGFRFSKRDALLTEIEWQVSQEFDGRLPVRSHYPSMLTASRIGRAAGSLGMVIPDTD